MSKELSSNIQHDLRREFHNMLGLLKIIKKDIIINDDELKTMIDMCLERENNVSSQFEELSNLLESQDE